VLQLIMDSLRYWVTEMHVDGFRFDLAATLARELHDVSKLGGVLRHHPPGPGHLAGEADRRAVGRGRGRLPGRQLPVLWAEWNGKYRDTVRASGRATRGTLSTFAYRLTGSERSLPVRRRKPYASINFITAHDGFTLRDLVSYNDKHNEANGEDNQDGDRQQQLVEHGRGRPTDDPGDQPMRERQIAQLSRHAAAEPGRADDLRRRRVRPLAARQQQRLLPGQRADLGLVVVFQAQVGDEVFAHHVAEGVLELHHWMKRSCSG
jgi:isoamylase